MWQQAWSVSFWIPYIKLEPEHLSDGEDEDGPQSRIFKPSRIAILKWFIFFFCTAVFSFAIFKSRSLPRRSLADLSESVTFNPATEFEVPPGGPSSKWESLMPAGGGFVNILDLESFWLLESPKTNEKLKLEPGEYCISVFHQLHCLASLRVAFAKLEGSANDSFENKLSQSGIDHLVHVNHCFDYLRQAIMCSGDISLESVRNGSVDGWNTKHQCRDYEAIKEFATRRADGATGIV
ncbi:hypothetical protein F5884DRAFT_140348 [Xylogone sp. PMI_703]|nr:hypothetical protein F5884DRAFT_140348 [Xylogone sp. PMI_703]